MINFLHTFSPTPTVLSFGPFNIYFYGVLIVIGIICGSLIIFNLAKPYGISKDTVIDSAFYVVLAAIAGGRIYDVLLELPFYIKHPINVFMIWKGGLAIHGAIIAGIAAIYYFAKKNKIDFILLASLYAPAFALGQAIGRWGNYFNQELFGLPTNLPWGIPIKLINRVAPYINSQYFHPTFLYESVGNFFIFLFLFWLHKLYVKRGLHSHILILSFYFLSYSILRFLLEFIRIDTAPSLFGIRWPQYASIILAIISIFLFYKNRIDLFLLIKNKKSVHQNDTK